MNDPKALISAYIDGLMNDEQAAELNTWVKASPDNADEFVRRTFIHRRIYENLHQRDIARMMEVSESSSSTLGKSLDDTRFDTETLGALLAIEENAGEPTIVDITDELARRKREAKAKKHAESQRWSTLISKQQNEEPKTKHYVIPKPLFYGGIAAIIAVAVLIIRTMVTPDQPAPLNIEDGPRFVQVATLVSQKDAKWDIGEHEIIVGKGIFNEPIKLIDGFATIRFDNEAEIIIEAPCAFEPISPTEMKLISGKIIGSCETDMSKGFTVRTRGSRIKDLGTRFGVLADRSGKALTEVFEGTVEVALEQDDDSNGTSRKLNRGDALGLDASGQEMARDQFEDQPFAKLGALRSGVLEISDNLKFLLNRPVVIDPGVLESDSEAFIFEEFFDSVLPEGIAVSIHKPGRYAEFTPQSTGSRILPAGMHVRSYIIHIDTSGASDGEGNDYRCRITFDQPILGVIEKREHWDAFVDAMKVQSSPPSDFKEHRGRLIEGLGAFTESQDIRNADWIRLLEDERTLEFKFYTSSGTDTIRVLVAVPDENGQ